MLSFSLAMVMTATATPDTAKHRKTSQLVIVRRNSSVQYLVVWSLDNNSLSDLLQDTPTSRRELVSHRRPSNLTLFHLRALLGHRNAADDEDDDSAPDDEMDVFLCHCPFVTPPRAPRAQ